jgi:hypothetical protein
MPINTDTTTAPDAQAALEDLRASLRGVRDALTTLCRATKGQAAETITEAWIDAAPELGPLMSQAPNPEEAEEEIGRQLFGEHSVMGLAPDALRLGQALCRAVEADRERRVGTHAGEFLLLAAVVALETPVETRTRRRAA